MSARGYSRDRAWSDRFLPNVRRIIGHHIVTVAPVYKDLKEATDLVFEVRAKAIACRLRKFECKDKYPGQFTLRYSRDSGAETELIKVINGHGDWLFYGYGVEETCDIPEWVIIDLKAFRDACYDDERVLKADGTVSGIKDNYDGTKFMWFRYDRIPNLVIAKSNEGFSS